MIRAGLMVILGLALWAGEPPAVADPIGLGERLALIDLLTTTYGRRIPPGTDLEQLRVWYAQDWAGSVSGPATEDAILAADACVRLRVRLRDEFGIEAQDGLDQADLLDLLHEAEATRRIAAAGMRDDSTTPRAAPAAPAAPRPAKGASSSAPASQHPAPPAWRSEVLPAFAEGVRRVTRTQKGDAGVMCVQFGQPGDLDFDGACVAFVNLVQKSPHTIHRAVFLIGHGTGVSVGGVEFTEHLKANAERYETLGGALERRPIDCLVLAACSKGGTVQMRSMREALGYYPLRRVATGDRSFANIPTVLAAGSAVVNAPADQAFRAAFRWRDQGVEAASSGEVGDDAKGVEQRVYRVELADGALVVTPQR